MSDKPYWPGQDRETRPEDGAPHAWIQWKGTSICMDLHCLCGQFTHIDGEFSYYVKCSLCGRIYKASQYLQLVPLTEEEISDPRMSKLDGLTTTSF